MKKNLEINKLHKEINKDFKNSLNKNIKCGHFGIKILRDGSWLYQESPIKRMEIVKLFSSVLKLENDGVYYLETPVEKGIIDVEDAPFTAISMLVEKTNGFQSLIFITNLGDKVIINDKNPLYIDLNKEKTEYFPYIIVRKMLTSLLMRHFV